MTSSAEKSDIVIALIHDDGEIGSVWKKFMEEMFTVDLPENYRDMGLDVECESVGKLEGTKIDAINTCSWKLFLLSHEMLEEVRNRESKLNRSDLLMTRPDKVIILILGEKSDTQFHDDVRKSLWVYRDFSKFHLVNATTQSKIFSDVIDIVSPLYIVFHPNIISSEDREQHLTLIANKPYPSVEGATFQVEFSDETKTTEANAALFNPCTLLLQNPGLSTGMINVKAYMCVPAGEDDNSVHKTQVGGAMKVWVQSDLDKLNSMLEKNNNPFHFLCQAYKIDSNDPSAVDIIDQRLTNSFRRHVPDNELARVFGTDTEFKADGAEGRSKEFAPTLLHFAAMHGLKNLTAQLLRCPGAVRAYGMANCDGDYPTNLAEKSGHWDLKNYMQSYMEVSAMVDYEVGDSRNTSQMVAQMVTGQYLPVPESLYEGNHDDPEDDRPHYVAMKPLTGNHMKQYDSPFIVPIPLSDDIPNYESILAQMIESVDDTYMEFGPFSDEDTSYPYGYGKDAPPPPPRDDVPSPPPLEEYPVLPSRNLPPSEDVTPLLPPPPLPAERSEDSTNIRRGGADRVSYGSLSIPKMHSYVSPAQRELITLQQKVKNGELTTNQAVIRFKEWERKHKEQAASFQFQQECLQRIRNSLMKSKEMKRKRGEKDDIEITQPIVAGSSTYDLVLKKTNDADPSEVIYGSTTRAPKLNDGFVRPSSVNSRGSVGSARTDNSSDASFCSGDSRKNSFPKSNCQVDYRTRPEQIGNMYSTHTRPQQRSPKHVNRPPQSVRQLPPNEYSQEPIPAPRPPPIPPREGPQLPSVPPRSIYH